MKTFAIAGRLNDLDRFIYDALMEEVTARGR